MNGTPTPQCGGIERQSHFYHIPVSSRDVKVFRVWRKAYKRGAAAGVLALILDFVADISDLRRYPFITHIEGDGFSRILVFILQPDPKFIAKYYVDFLSSR